MANKLFLTSLLVFLAKDYQMPVGMVSGCSCIAVLLLSTWFAGGGVSVYHVGAGAEALHAQGR
jgi:hypothetical protein